MDARLPGRCGTLFEPVRQLGAGAFGAVWLATQRDLGRSVVVKLLRPDAARDPREVERFVNEGRVTARLKHPSIVVVLDQGVDEGLPWIAYEYLRGSDLRARLAAGPLPPETVRAVGTQVAGALAEAHANGVLHRDIKPDNVLESSPGHYKVADFGIAKWSAATLQTAAGIVLGTPDYLAPELIAGDLASPRSDLYALAIMLHELMTGTVPLRADGIVALFEKRRSESPPPLPAGAPPGLDALFARALHPLPERRFLDAEGLALAWEAAWAEAPQALLAPVAAARAAPTPTARAAPVDRTAPATRAAEPGLPGGPWLAVGVAAVMLVGAWIGAARPLLESVLRAPPSPVSASPATAPRPADPPPVTRESLEDASLTGVLLDTRKARLAANKSTSEEPGPIRDELDRRTRLLCQRVGQLIKRAGQSGKDEQWRDAFLLTAVAHLGVNRAPEDRQRTVGDAVRAAMAYPATDRDGWHDLYMTVFATQATDVNRMVANGRWGHLDVLAPQARARIERLGPDAPTEQACLAWMLTHVRPAWRDFVPGSRIEIDGSIELARRFLTTLARPPATRPREPAWRVAAMLLIAGGVARSADQHANGARREGIETAAVDRWTAAAIAIARAIEAMFAAGEPAPGLAPHAALFSPRKAGREE